MTTIIKSIIAINPSAVVSVYGDDVNRIDWLEGTSPIANDIILAKQLELQSEKDNKEIIKEQNKQSALTKLSALGLTADEIKAIIG